jgi:SPOR domain
MRFGNFGFTGILAEREKFMSQRVCMALAALFICLCPLTANAQARRIDGYAVQVAALSSQRSADELVRGLGARGINAYSIGGVTYGARRAMPLHRVRIGNFPTIVNASVYAEKMISAGLLASYAIAAYEDPAKVGPPAEVSYTSNGKVQTLAQKFPGRQFGPEVIDVVAAIGSRGWLLLSSESINLTARYGNTAINRELSKLAAIGSRGWSMNGNIAKVLAAPGPINIALPNETIANSSPAEPPLGASSSPSNLTGVEIGREDLSPASSTLVGLPTSRSGIYGSTPRLQGSIEMRNGRMYMNLRNGDPDRVFSGVARISLSDDQKQQDVSPIQVTLLPNREASFPVDDAALLNGGWILMVYDLNGAARLIRGASLSPPKLTAQAPSATDSTTPVDPNLAPEAPPAYVTGVYDSTNWTQPQAPPQTQGVELQDEAASNAANTQDAGGGGLPATNPQADVGPGLVAANLRQIAATSENVTLELDISAQNPIKNVTVTLRAGDFQDVRQAFIPTSQGSVPFLVPAAFANGGVFYEVKDEAQRVLTSGSANLRSLGK